MDRRFKASEMSSILYSHRMVYHLVMRLLYGKYFEARYTAIANEIPCGAEVMDVCAGDCYLYLRYLHAKSVKYLGLDISPRLVQWARKHGAQAREFNVWQDELPASDIVVMQASLYQFVPKAEKILAALARAARQTVIVAEPIRNLTSSSNRIFAMLSHKLTVPSSANNSYSGTRFDRESLTILFKSFSTFERSFIIPGGREMVGIFRGQHRC